MPIRHRNDVIRHRNYVVFTSQCKKLEPLSPTQVSYKKTECTRRVGMPFFVNCAGLNIDIVNCARGLKNLVWIVIPTICNISFSVAFQKHKFYYWVPTILFSWKFSLIVLGNLSKSAVVSCELTWKLVWICARTLPPYPPVISCDSQTSFILMFHRRGHFHYI